MRKLLILLAVTSLLSGCGSEPTRPQQDAALHTDAAQRVQGGLESLPQNMAWGTLRTRLPERAELHFDANDTPQGAMLRMVESYEARADSVYAKIFTGDFRFSFSNVTDPTLVQEYSAGWFKSDEAASATHMAYGYTPPGGSTLPPVSSVVIQLDNITPQDDNASPDPATHKVLGTRVDGSITVPQAGSEPLTFLINNNFEMFYLVRGDVAVGLDASQPADANHWYVYRWDDQSTGGFHTQTAPQTWGLLKALYR
jgi:hypothetical protein